MRIIFGFILLIGLGLAGFAAYMVMQTFSGYERQIAEMRRGQVAPIEMTEIIVAKAKLPYGKLLDTDDVLIVNWPTDYLPSGAYTDIDSLFGGETDEPRAILRIIERNEPILAVKVSDFGDDAGIRSRLSPGMRAFTLTVNVSTGVSGFLQPNDRVDIYWTGNDGEQTITKLILESVRLVAVDQTENEDVTRTIIARTVTVEVSPQVVARLTQAQQTGRLTLSLRGTEDTALTGTIQVDLSDVTLKETEVTTEAARVCKRRGRRGTEVVETIIPCPDE